GSFFIVDADIEDQGGSAAVTGYSCTNTSGNGANWTWEGCSFKWSGGGTDSNWNTGANWLFGAAPGVNDTALFTNLTNRNCYVNVNASVKGIQLTSTWAGKVIQNTGNTITVGSGGYTQESGTFIGANKKITVGASFALTGGSFTSTADTIQIAGNITRSGTATFIHNSGTVFSNYNGYTTFNPGGSIRFYNFLMDKISSGYEFTIPGTDSIYVEGSLKVLNTIGGNGGVLVVAGDVIIPGNVWQGISGSTYFLLNGSGDQYFGNGGSGGIHSVPRVIVNKSGGTLYLQDTIRVTGISWIHSAGTVNAGTSRVVFTGNGVSIDAAGMSFNDVRMQLVSGGSAATISGTMDINGALNFVNGNYSVNGGAITLSGDLYSSPSAGISGTTTITLDGVGTQVIGGVACDFPNGALTINKATGKVSLAAAVSWPAAVNLTSGTLEQGDYDFTVTGALTVSSGARYVNTGTGDLVLGSTLTNNGTIYMNSFSGGSGDGDSIWIRSSVAGTPRTVTGGSTGWRLYDINLKDITAGSVAADSIFVYSGTNTSGNTRCGFRVGGIVPYSIGTNSGVIHSTGTVSSNTEMDTLTFSAALPVTVGEGDRIILNANNSGLGRDTVYIFSKVSSAVAVLSAPARFAVSNEDFEIKRAFNTLQSWENAREDNLVTQRVIEKGVCYNDGIFAEQLMIENSTTDATSYMWLTVAEGHRHNGKRYSASGVRIEPTADWQNGVFAGATSTNYTKIEWVQVKNVHANGRGITSHAANTTINNVILYSTNKAATSRGFNASKNSTKFYNSIVYGWYTGVKVEWGLPIYNITSFGNELGISAENGGSSIAVNCIALGNTTNWAGALWNNTDSKNNVGLSGVDNPPGSGDVLTTATSCFTDTALTTLDLSLNRYSLAVGAADSTGLLAIFTNDINGVSRLGKPWDIGAYSVNFPFMIAARSIGTNAAALYTGAGNGSTNASGDTITLSSGSFPANIGEGDSIRLTSVYGFIASRVSDTKVALQEAVSGNLAAQNVTIYRAYNTMNAWEFGRQGNLVARNTVEKGVCYNDGVFTGDVTISGSTTDSAHYSWLTVNPDSRHKGSAGTGVRISGAEIYPFDNYSIVEWMEISNFGTEKAILVRGHHVTCRNNIIHDGEYGIKASAGDGSHSNIWHNNLIYNLTGTAISSDVYGGLRMYSTKIFNNTIYKTNLGINSIGTREVNVRDTIINNLVVGNVKNWYAHSTSAAGHNNAGAVGDTLPGGTGVFTTAYMTFIDTATAAPNLRLKYGADAQDAADSAGLTAVFVRDIQDTLRAYYKWDIGAYERSDVSPPDTNRRSIGTNAAVIYSTGTAAVTDAYTIDLTGATLPSNVGPGDMLVVNANSATASDRDTLYLTQRVSDSRVTVWPGAKFGYSGEDYLIRRAYTSLANWETGREGNLVTRHAIEQGVATNDGALSAFTIDGSTIDNAHFMWLTSAPYARHNGVSGNWARIDRGGANGSYVVLLDEYSVVEGIECLNAGNHWSSGGIDMQRNGCIARGNLIHNNNGGYGIKIHDGNGSRSAVIANNIVYNCGDAIYSYLSVSGYRVLIYNNTVYRNSNGFYFNGTHLTHKDSLFNNISLGNTINYNVVGYGDIVADYNAGEIGKMPGEGTHNIALSPYFTFRDTNSTTPDLRLKPRCGAMDAGDSNQVKAWLRKDFRDTIRQYRQFDMGAFEVDGALPPDTVRRSIGTNAGDVYSSNTVTAIDANTIRFNGIILPAGVGEGDRLFINQDNNPAGQRETTYVYQRVNDSTLLVWPGVQNAHSSQDYVIRRVYNTMTAWETARQGDLVADNRLEKGVAYNDGPFSEIVELDGSTTDSLHILWLSANPLQRHNGIIGTGVRVSSSMGGSWGVFSAHDDNVLIDGFTISSTGNTPGLRSASTAGKHEYKNLLIHDVGGNGLGYYGGSTEILFHNSIIVRAAGYGVNGNLADINQVKCYNITALKSTQDTINVTAGFRYCIAQNCIALYFGPTSSYADFLNMGAASSNNISHDGSAPGANSLTFQTGYELFVDTTATSLNLKLRSHSPAIGTGTNLSAVIASKDFEDSTRGSTWDIGADQFNGNAFEFKSGTNEYSIGKKPDVPVTVSGVAGSGPWTIIFSNAPDLSRIFAGDAFNDGSTLKHKWLITAVDNTAKTVTVKNNEYSATGLVSPSSSNTYHATVGRFYNTMQRWEDMRDGDLVTGDRLEKGVCYADSSFDSTLTIDGSTTDASHYMWLTAATSDRHNGRGDAGVIIDRSKGGSPKVGNVILDRDSYTHIEWLNIKGYARGDGVVAYGVNRPDNVTGTVYNNLLIHDATYTTGWSTLGGISVGQDAGTALVQNCMIYNLVNSGSSAGSVNGVFASYNQKIFNNTIYNLKHTGGGAVTGISMTDNALCVNNLVVGNTTSGTLKDFNISAHANHHHNISGDATATGTGSLTAKSAFVQFVDTASATCNLHLKAGADAIGKGDSTGISQYLITDIDDTVRYYGRWDIGADERHDMDTTHYYVDYKNGVDAVGYGTLANPYKTIDYTYNTFPSTGVTDSVWVIEMLPGTHIAATTIQLDANGPDFTRGTPLILRSYSNRLDSMAEVAAITNVAGLATLFAPSIDNITFDRIRFRGISNPISGSVSMVGYYTGSCPDYLTVKNSIFYFDSLFDDRRDSYSAYTALSLKDSRHLTVQNNVFIGKNAAISYDRGRGVLCGADSLLVINNVFKNMGNIITADYISTMKGLVFANNIIDSCAYSLFETNTITDTLEAVNCSFTAMSGAYIRSASNNSKINLINERMLASSPIQSYDWRTSRFGKLYKNSPLRDAGVDTFGVLPLDFYGIARTGNPDIGACELNRDADFMYADTVHLYVNPSRPNDAGDGRTIATAKQTVQAAYTLVPAVTDSYYVINLMPGTYNVGGKILQFNGNTKSFPTRTKGVTVRGYYAIKDSMPLLQAPGTTYGIIDFDNNIRNVSLEGLRFAPVSGGGGSAAIGFSRSAATDFVKNFKVERCVFDTSDNTGYGSAMFNVYDLGSGDIRFDSVDVVNCVFKGLGTGSSGRVFSSLITDTLAVYGVRILNNTFDGLEYVFYGCFGSSVDRFLMGNNIFKNVNTIVTGSTPDANTRIFNSCFNGITTYGFGSAVIQDTIRRDPLLVSTAFNSPSFCKLQDESPCVGYGKDSSFVVDGNTVRYTPSHDFYGLPRNGGNDVGACQYDPLGEIGKRVFQWEKRGGIYAKTEDSRIYDGGVTANYGAANLLNVGKNPSVFSSMIKFGSFAGDESQMQVPRKAHVDSAFVYLYATQGYSGNIECYRIVRDWKEGVSNGTTETGAVTWNSAKHGTVTWGTAGLGALSDRMPDIVSTSSITTGAWSRLNVTPLVQDWVSGVTNYGLSIADLDDNLGGLVMFVSKDTSKASIRPKLVVYYDPDTVTIVKQQGTTDAFSETQDLYISQAEQDNNFGAASNLYINSASPNKKHILFNMKDMVGPTSITNGATITRAELVMYRSNTTAIPADAAKAWRVRARWHEGLQDGSAGVSSWYASATTAHPWQTAGGTAFPDVDSVSMSSGNTVNNTVGGAVSIRFDSAAQDWADGSLTRGLMIQPSGVIGSDAGFYSTEGAAAVSPFYAPKVIATFAGGTGSNGSLPWVKPEKPLLKTYASVTGQRDTLRFRNGVNGYDSTYDTYVNYWAPAGTFESDDLFLTDTAGTYPQKILIRFGNIVGNNAGQIPFGAVIDTAYIRFVENPEIGASRGNVMVSRVNEYWKENEASWNNRIVGSPWSNPGIKSPSSASLFYKDITLTGTGNWYDTVHIPATLAVQNWANGQPNYGVVISAGSGWSSLAFFNSENATVLKRPQLVVAYRKKEQVEVQNIDRFATSSSTFSSAESLSGQFFMSFNTRSDSTDGMMNQFKTAATSPGEKISNAYDLMPSDNKHQNLFNILRRSNPAGNWSYYADSVRSSDAISFTIVESTTTRIRYKINTRTIRDAGAAPRNAAASTEFTVYPTGQIVVYDSSFAADYSGQYNYAVTFHTKDGTGTLYDNDSTIGGLHSTSVGSNTLHDWAFGTLGYLSSGFTYRQNLFESVTGSSSGGNFTGIQFYNSWDAAWNSNVSTVRQSYYLDMSRDDITDADTLEAMIKDKQYPSVLNDFRTGTLKTNAAGDLNSDGFNEREGVYELQCDAASGEAYFWFNKDATTRQRYMPAFKVNGYTWTHAPTKVMLITEFERVIDTCYASKGDVNISLVNAGASGYLVFQLNRVITGPCVIYIGRDDNLAVEMNTFTGNSDSGLCILAWSTESEHENRGFRLLRREVVKNAKADTSFTVIADYESSKELVGKITTQSRSEYSFADHKVALGKTYEYALEAVDMKGKVERYVGTVILTVDQLFGFTLEQNYPNPFNPTTVIKYSVPGKYSTAKKQAVSLNVYDIKGRLVKTLSSEDKLPGAYTVFWNGKANNGRLIASGIYFYRIDVAGRYSKIRKMVVVK
ncbi:MAG: DNRLRE domain-containing protein, partial [Fibrobacteres bacterium]|nr:DNRLRE domain-containing protein [Fibrobacterota bacterium]